MMRNFSGLHTICRNSTTPYLRTSDIFRIPVNDAHVLFSISFTNYHPIDYTDPSLIGKVWADPDIRDPNFRPKWNHLDGNIDRRSYQGSYKIEGGRPLNPVGRTGLKGRGVLGKWGPNHAADSVVTRWKKRPSIFCDQPGIVIDDLSGKPILQFIAIVRQDVLKWAFPGGMVNPGEEISFTLEREFCEEALNSLHMSKIERHNLNKSIHKLFRRSGLSVYEGYVDDPRNTDNSWMETKAVNFHHDQKGQQLVDDLKLVAGDDAREVDWMNATDQLDMYASHKQILNTVVDMHGAHW